MLKLNVVSITSIYALLLHASISMAGLPKDKIELCSSDKFHSEVTTPCIENSDAIFSIGRPAILKKIPSDTSAQVSEISTKEAIIKYFSNEPWSKKNEFPAIGLAMSGGGSKSAPFVMGVMKQFAENGWMEKTDIISSVSGGGYSAYYFYKKMWMIKKYPEYLQEYRNKEDLDNQIKSLPSQKEIFADIRAENYGEKPGEKGCVLNPQTNLTRCNVITADYKTYGNLPRGRLNCDRFELNSTRHQGYVECYQDVLSVLPGGKTKTNTWPPIPAYFSIFATTVLSLPFHHIANSLFDWKLPLSPSQEIYKTGIKRTYGNTPDDKFDFISTDIVPTPDEFDFNALLDLYKDCDGCGKLPWWIINMTNKVENEENSRFLNKTIFELTGNSMGSGNYGYLFGFNLSDLLPNFRPIDAVAASGAFFDTLSAYKPYKASGRTAFLALHGFNARWGIEVPNYQVSNDVRTIHSFIPWPFYYDHAFDRDRKSAYIRLADGGQSGENLGVYSLLRRGTRNIVVADGAEDLNEERSFSRLPELCMTNKFLNSNGLEMVFIGYPNNTPHKNLNEDKVRLSEICGEDAVAGPIIKTEYQDKFSPFQWKKSIWVGEVVRIESRASPYGFETLKGVKIFYIKSAVDYDLLISDLGEIQKDQTVCDGKHEIHGILSKNDMPCTLLGYIIDSGNYKVDKVTKALTLNLPAGKNVWPQSSTVADTANGSANTFTAYRDLGWYSARKLSCLMDGNGVNESIENLDRCMNSKN